jgi:ATP-binding cassette subfamily C protein
MWEGIRKALALLPPGTGWRWAALLPLSLAAAAAEAAGAAAVYGLIRVLTDPSEVARVPLAAAWLHWIAKPEASSVVAGTTVLVMLVYLLRNVVLSASWYVQERVVFGTVVQMASRAFRAYLEAPYPFFFRRNSAALIQRVQRSTEVAATQVLASVVHIATEVFVAAGLVMLLAMTAPPVTLAAVAATLALLLLPAAFGGRLFRRWGHEEQELEKVLLQELQQGLGAIKEVRVAGRESYFHGSYARRRAEHARLQRRRSTLQELVRLAVETTFVVALVGVVLLLTVLDTTGAQSLSVLGLYAYAGFRLVPSANRVARSINCIRSATPFVCDLHEDLAALQQQAVASPCSGGTELLFQSTIAFEGVSFSYVPGRPAVLDGLDFTIRRGESVAILGATGAGKSTVVDLLLGLLEPSSGRVLVDGHDIRTGIRSWQRQVGLVPQEPHILDGSIRANVAFGLDPGEVDDARLHQALHLAQLHALVASLPEGLDTRLGERGVCLSGGQRQRVAIARALYHAPAVLVFDEATSALDLETERELADAIAALHGEHTVVVVAHRPSTVRRCGRLLVLRGGRLAASGPPGELEVTEPGWLSQDPVG